VLRLVDDHELRAQFGRTGREISGAHSWASACASVVDAYRDAIAAHAREPAASRALSELATQPR
jgi:hypothetical protein